MLVHGRPVSGPGPDRAVVFQEDALFPWLTAAENIAFGLKRLPLSKDERRARVERFLTLVGLEGYGGYLPQALSGGMKQRVALARVLVLEPELLLMDEPFASWDAQTRWEMHQLLTSLQADLAQTVVLVTHDLEEAVKLADRVLVMEKTARPHPARVPGGPGPAPGNGFPGVHRPEKGDIRLPLPA